MRILRKFEFSKKNPHLPLLQQAEMSRLSGGRALYAHDPSMQIGLVASHSVKSGNSIKAHGNGGWAKRIP